jgi:hypothetical protein
MMMAVVVLRVVDIAGEVLEDLAGDLLLVVEHQEDSNNIH